MTAFPRIDCPLCGRHVGLNLSSYSGSPRIDTHADVSGRECASSRTFVSQRVYDKAASKAASKAGVA